MPSRSSFSIRKLLSAKSRSETSSESEVSRDSRHSHESHISNASSNSTVFHPDSSFSITTPQAERGLTDNSDHELSQEEIDRIKAVVAAAAAAAAGSLRLRMDEDSESATTVQFTHTAETAMTDAHPDKRLKEQGTKKDAIFNAAENSRQAEFAANAPFAQTASVLEDDNAPPSRKKNRRVPQPIVVPPRPMSRSVVIVRPPQSLACSADGTTSGVCANERGETREESRSSNYGENNIDCVEEITSHRDSIGLEAKGGRGQQQALGRPSANCLGQGRLRESNEIHQEAATQHNDEQRAGKSDKEQHEKEEGAAPAVGSKPSRCAANGQASNDNRLCLNAVETTKHHNASSPSKQAAKATRALIKQASQADDAFALRSAAWKSGESTPPASFRTPKSAASSPTSPPALSLFPAIPRASVSSSRKSLPAPSTYPPVKVLPPPPPPRVSSYFGTRGSWKFKSDKAPLSSTTTTTAEKPPISTAKPEQTADGLVHLLYRDKKRQPDEKKDSGIALNRSQSSLLGIGSTPDTADDFASKLASEDTASGSDTGSCIDLLQALAIHPDEAGALRRQTIDSVSPEAQITSKVKNHKIFRNSKRPKRSKISKTPTGLLKSESSKNMDSNMHLDVECSADGVAQCDLCITPTFTQPRTAPTPGPETKSSSTNTPVRAMSPSSSHRASLIGSSRASIVEKPPLPLTLTSISPPSPKKQARFLPLRLNKGLPDTSLRVQRKRSTKKITRQRVLFATSDQILEGNDRTDQGKFRSSSKWDNTGNDINGTSGGGSSRWTLPENVTELFNGRLFNRMEINETLPFEKLVALRESRALARKQHEESEKRKKAKLLQDELDEKEERERREQIRKEQQLKNSLEAERTPTRNSSQRERPQPQNPDDVAATTGPSVTLVVSDGKKIQVRPLQSGSVSAATDAESYQISMEAAAHVSPLAENNLSRPLQAHSLPMPHHFTSTPILPDDKNYEEVHNSRRVDYGSLLTANTANDDNILNFDRDDPSGGVTPVEPFYLQDLPSRVGAAGVRVSILLPVEEEEAYFATSAAQHKERRQREQVNDAKTFQKQCQIKPEFDDAGFIPEAPKSPLDELGPFPSPPTKNPMRFRGSIKDAEPTSYRIELQLPLAQAPAQTIPQVTVTDVDKHAHHQPAKLKGVKKGKAKSLREPAASGQPHVRDDATYVYLAATPFSLVMPTFRHGPIRLNRTGFEELWGLDSCDSYDEGHFHPSMANIATIDETLDWTAFQMAIMGGAGDLFDNCANYGQAAVGEADETEQLNEWFESLNLRPEQLFKCAKDDKVWIRPKPSVSVKPPRIPPRIASVASAMPAVSSATHPFRQSFQPPQQSHMHRTLRTAGSQWSSFSSSIDMEASSGANPAIGVPYQGYSHRRTATTTSIGTEASWYSNTSSIHGLDHQSSAGVAALALRLTISPSPSPSLSNSMANSSYAMGLRNESVTDGSEAAFASSPAHRYSQLSFATVEPRTSFGSVASYESMPQSPMADLVMTRGADGKEYVAPMGYNLSHDLGDYLLWEQENVSSVTP
ncbi:hypothetical protein SEPCBS57363_005694 [Sporothrix epigloea]|uniref:Uncharacterized protein n=1 Tax=Sporothrix epigloea TaxID=1892477 RepID=A0ABP0E193_9PEZI